MGEPIRSAGQVPKRWKRRQHSERQARLERTTPTNDNPVRVIPGIDRPGHPIGEVRIIQGPVVPHGLRKTETLRSEHRWNQQDGKLIAVRADRRCSVCSKKITAGNTAWWNPYARRWTCTRVNCTPVQHP